MHWNKVALKVGLLVFVMTSILLFEEGQAVPMIKHTITVIQSENGSIVPAGGPSFQVTVEDHRRKTFTIRPASGFYIQSVEIDGSTIDLSSNHNFKLIGKVGKYIFKDVTIDHTITAFFVPIPTLTIIKLHNGIVASLPRGIRCGNDCENRFNVGKQVVLKAKPAKNFMFSEWTGCTPDASNDTKCELTVTTDTTVTATFVTTATLEIEPEYYSIKQFCPLIFTASLTTNDGKELEDIPFEWSSSDENIVKLGSDGSRFASATGYAPGTVQITVSAGGKSATATLAIEDGACGIVPAVQAMP